MLEFTNNYIETLKMGAEMKKSKEEKIYEQFELCKNYIRTKMSGVSHLCENTRTIEQSNDLYQFFMEKFKAEAYKLIEKSVVKPYVIYRVNKYFFF